MRATKTPTGIARKGSISVLSSHNRLRLRFRVDGKQRVIILGLDDTPENWKRAEIIAYQVGIDLGSGNDDTLARYEPQKKQNRQALESDITITISGIHRV